ncbi:hypothetical protein G6F61_000863 [Rhizopus arrhizus]|nr:hypothetical protein G6F61_000863 [Rhizopus arrhizus]
MKHKPLPLNSTLNAESQTKKSERLFERELIGTPTSSRSYSLFDTCACCGKNDCEALEDFNKTVKKLESDTRLAAEIGQGLLHKHETFVAESNQQTAKLNKQLEECHIRIHDLEQSLDFVESSKDELLKEKNKLYREQQKKRKTLDETISDLEIANERCQQLSAELESKNNELEKLRVFKFMVRQSEVREETLTSKLEDTHQELAICRKNELLLESKIKKLKMKYESLYNTYEQLTKASNNNNNIITNNATFINNNNNSSSSSSSNNFKFTPHHAKQYHSTEKHKDDDHLVDYINEISSTNNKLRSDLLNYKEQLSEAREEIDTLNQKVLIHTQSRSNTLQKEINNKKMKKRAESVSCKDTKSHKPPARSKTSTLIPPISAVSSSMPTSSLGTNSAIVHHHYHYYMKNKKGESSTSSCTDFDCCDENVIPAEKQETHPYNEPNHLVLSPSTSSSTQRQPSEDLKSRFPFVILQDQISQILSRLNASDIRILNRRLKRAFDIVELSNMSNSVIENIMIDIDALDNRFLWLKEEDDSLFAFFPFLEILKDALRQLGSLKVTVNDLQVAYVQKIQENELRVEEEIIQKRKKKKTMAAEEPSSLSWLTSIFYKSSSNTGLDDDDTLVRSYKDDPLLSRRQTRPVPYHRHKLSPAVPIIRSKKSFYRNEQHEGTSIRPMIIPSENVNNSNGDVPPLSSSWLGGK